MQKDPRILEYYIDTSGYYPYLMFSLDHRAVSNKLIQAVIAQLKQIVPALKITHVFGPSSRPAADGKQYSYYARLAGSPNQAVLKLLHHQVFPKTYASTVVSEGLLPNQTPEVERLREYYEARLTKAKQYFRELTRDVETLQVEVRSFSRLNRKYAFEQATIKQEQQEFQAELANVTQSLNRLKLERDTLREQSILHTQNLEILKGQLKQQKSTSNATFSERDVLQSRIEALKSQLQNSTQLLIKKDARTNQLADQLAELKQCSDNQKLAPADDLNAAEQLLEELEAEKAKLHKEINELQAKELETETQVNAPKTSIIKSVYADRIKFIQKSERLLFDHSTPDSIRIMVFDCIVWILHNAYNHMTSYKQVKSLTHWHEAHVGRDYRLYFRKHGSKHCDILFAPKNDQTKNLKYLRSLDT